MVWGILVIRNHTCKILYPDSYEGYIRVAFLYSFAFGHSSSLTLKTENWTNKNKWKKKKKKTENWVASGSWACLSGNLPALDQLFRLPRIPYPPYQLFSLSLLPFLIFQSRSSLCFHSTCGNRFWHFSYWTCVSWIDFCILH